MLCHFTERDGLLVCVYCGQTLPLDSERRRFRCNGKRQKNVHDRIRLGSAIKAGLDKLGVTQDRVAALVESIGLPPSCLGCAKRQEQLDEFDRKTEAWLKKAAKWLRGQS